MSGWLQRIALEVHSATALGMAAAAAFFASWQIAANDRTSRDQAARELYREFPADPIQRPELAARDSCALTRPVERAGFESHVDCLFSTAEQVMDLDPADGFTAIPARLRAHAAYLCTFGPDDIATLTPAVVTFLRDLTRACHNAPKYMAGAP